MTKQPIGPNGQFGSLDVLTSSELKEAMGHGVDTYIRDWVRGIDYVQFSGQGPGVAGVFTIPQAAEQGYTWSLKLISAQLSAAATLSIYPGDVAGVAPIGSVVAIAQGAIFEAVYTWSSNQAILKDGRNITLLPSAGTILNWRLLAEQVPTEMQGKL